MGRFILKRLGHGIIVIFGVSLIVFVVTRLIGDPVRVMLPIEARSNSGQPSRSGWGSTVRSTFSLPTTWEASRAVISETRSGSGALRWKLLSSACR